MSTTEPDHPVFHLPDDPTVLSALHEQLSDYLSTLERNTDSISGWLQKNEDRIIVGHHQLVRALILRPDEEAARTALKNLGDAAGFVLSMRDFSDSAAAAFGKDSQICQEIAAQKREFPADLFEELPQIVLPENEPEAPKSTAVKIPTAKPAPPPKKGFMSSVSSWFKKEPRSEKEEEPVPDPAAAEALRRKIKILRGELISLQSDRHYYLDSYMDWIAEMWEPENPEKPAGADHLMRQYEDPRYILRLAHHDYEQVLKGRALGLKAQALKYSTLVELMDKEDDAAFAKQLPVLFTKPDTEENLHTRKLILQDYGVESFVELALTKVMDMKGRYTLLSAALACESSLKYTGAKTYKDILQIILDQTLDKNPLHPSAVGDFLRACKKLAGKSYNPANLLGLEQPGPNIFEKIAVRFDHEPRAHVELLAKLVDYDTASALVSVRNALTSKNVAELEYWMRSLDGRKFTALWNLSYPQRSFLADLTACAVTPQALSRTLDLAFFANLLGELQPGGKDTAGRLQKLDTLIEKTILPAFQDFSIDTFRTLLATAYAHEGLDHLRAKLAEPGGWLEQITTRTDVAEKGRLPWISALLEPFGDDIPRANILYQASQTATNAATRKALALMEINLVGENIPFGDEGLLINLGRLANIWYHHDQGCLRFTVSGTDNILKSDVTPHQASDIISLIRRRSDFLAEDAGLYRPEKVDSIRTDEQGTKIYWRRFKTDLNITTNAAAALHARPDFVHFNDGKTFVSHNNDSIALIAPLTDGTHIIVDKYGWYDAIKNGYRGQLKPPALHIGNTQLNPKNIGIIVLKPETNAIEFRIESSDFDRLVSGQSDNAFFELPLGSKMALTQVRDALGNDPYYVSAPQHGIYFNLAALGYMIFENEGKKSGFQCRKRGTGRKSSFIEMPVEIAQEVLDIVAAQPGVFSIMNLVTHKDNIEDAYYNAEQKKLYLVLDGETHEISCDAKSAYKALSKLSREDGFSVVGVSRKAPHQPADIINIGRAILFNRGAGKNQIVVTTDTNTFDINLNPAGYKTLLDGLKKQGLKESARAATASPWTTGVAAALAAFRTLRIPNEPPVGDLSASSLFQVVSGQAVPEPLPQPKKDFGIAAQKTDANEGPGFTYPPSRSIKKTKPAF